MNSIRRLSAVLLIPLLLLISCRGHAHAFADIKNRQYHEQRGDMIWEVPISQKVIAFTFDDGPDPTETAQILDVLHEYNAKSTFFAIGKKIAAYPEIAGRVISEGHELANHTYNHVYFKRPTSVDQVMKELKQTEDEIVKVTGRHSSLFRPPGGMYDETLVKVSNLMGLKPVLWSWHQDTRDWNRPGVWSISSKVIKNARSGDIVLFHDYVHGQSQTHEALQIILPALEKQGYRFVTVSELIRLSASEKAAEGRQLAY
ncbi:polysaccharide deacetylase [Paenibacillus sp. FSL R7-0273]|uniref:polysaccharide deacetylase family protein n=1 Tax=Paenibacillus sp. FSL R7-0273 TaxID=1536772 RepID=UPI0004F92A70|nr:polysaccharide deacetylase family protein [Paenibacillus sp. FSL R7-0273]AIQ45276.1 polysaccharide deacetylase [Paenibacillus sp. FSL R7-0273]OMF88897.1 polysaccharide deacetylase [Paenibacillus sp. FSL R7-0273]